MIRKHQLINKEVDGKVTKIGTVYMKKYRVVVELGGYKFKTARITDRRVLNDRYKTIMVFLDVNAPQEECMLFFEDKDDSMDTLQAVEVSPDLVVTSTDLGWEDDTHTIQDLHTYYKESSERILV